MKKKILLVISIILLSIFGVGIYTQLLYPIKIEKVVVLYDPPYEEELDNIIKKGLILSPDDIFISQKNFLLIE
ncbi:hypothetical protein [Anaerobranca gottschalkii]|uniref:hypothetical protein n=1 Tax=Anaerobranca gottschalkii TaxID=108328 RepID=UPI000B8798EC|nr:hypothetical protein [Anaerobranca gottschalkii]